METIVLILPINNTRKGKLYYKTIRNLVLWSLMLLAPLWNSDDSELCWSEFLCQLSHLLPSHKWNNSLKGKFVLRCHSHMHTIHKLPCITVVQHYTKRDLSFFGRAYCTAFSGNLPILDTCHICIGTYGLQCAISNCLQRLCNQRFPVLPSFYESIFT